MMTIQFYVLELHFSLKDLQYKVIAPASNKIWSEDSGAGFVYVLLSWYMNENVLEWFKVQFLCYIAT